jgi:hypothetical protein
MADIPPIYWSDTKKAPPGWRYTGNIRKDVSAPTGYKFEIVKVYGKSFSISENRKRARQEMEAKRMKVPPQSKEYVTYQDQKESGVDLHYKQPLVENPKVWLGVAAVIIIGAIGYKIWRR